MEKIKPVKVKAVNPKELKLGQWFHRLGFGFHIMTMRGSVAVDTIKELQEEFNRL
jgi:hypothetical protein